MHRSSLILLALVVATALLFWMFAVRSKSTSLSCSETRSVIVAFGDSLVAGYGAEPGQGFVEQLAKKIHLPIKNGGISGNTTAEGLARIDEVVNLHPDIVIVVLGGNDALQKIPQAVTEANLDSILVKLTKAQVRVILVGVQGAILQDPYASMFVSLAKKYDVTYVPNILAGLIGHSDLMSDAIHPNAAGYAKVSDRILPALQKACTKVPK